MKCPGCGLINPEIAESCDCGYDFKTAKSPYYAQRLPTEVRKTLLVPRIAAGASAVLLLVLTPFGLLIPLVPLVWYNRRLVWRRPPLPLKQWLAQAVGIGFLTCVAALLGLLVFPFDLTWIGFGEAVYFATVALLNVVLAVSAIRVYYGAGRESGDIRVLAQGLVSGLIYSVCVVLLPLAVGVPNHVRPRVRAGEAGPAANLRTVFTANQTYSATYQQGFAGTLAQLGPTSGPCPGVSSACADLLDSLLSGVNPSAAAPIKSSYRFTYAAPNASPSPEKPNTTFSLVATPFSPGATGTSTFCVDQTGVVLRDSSGSQKTAVATGCGWTVGGTVGPL